MEVDFHIIGFTTPGEWRSPNEEAQKLCRYLESGAVNIFHIRKPEASESYVRSLINQIQKNWHSSLVLHSHYYLKHDFGFKGIHNEFSKSCHSLEEISNCTQGKNYVFLSPIFDSISKQGYKSKFSLSDHALLTLTENFKIIALGGIQPSEFRKLFDSKFAGAALLGYLWGPKPTIEEKIQNLIAEKQKLNSY